MIKVVKKWNESDKKRLIELYQLGYTFPDSEGKANFESAEDNLQDLATYAIMMLAYIKKGGEK